MVKPALVKTEENNKAQRNGSYNAVNYSCSQKYLSNSLSDSIKSLIKLQKTLIEEMNNIIKKIDKINLEGSE